MRSILMIGGCFLLLPISPASAQVGKSVGAIFGGFLGMTAGKAIGKAGSEDVEDALRKTTVEFNKQLPKQIDGDTRADSSDSGPGKRITFRYTITSASSREIDRKYFNTVLTEQFSPTVCGAKSTEFFFKKGVTLTYSYKSRDGVPIEDLVLTPKKCGYSG
jgi:hypothetical protein